MPTLRIMLRCLTLCCALGVTANAAGTERVVPSPGKLELIDLGPVDGVPPATLIKAHNKFFVCYDGVVPPTVHSILLLEHTEIQDGERVLDLGTGTGIQAIFAAEKAAKVIATDIDPLAVKNTQANIERYELQNKIEARTGDLLEPVKGEEPFDVIIFSLIYPFSETTKHLWEVHERFFKTADKYLTPNGRIYYQAGFLENIPDVRKMVESNGWRIMQMHMYADLVHDREPIIFMLQRAN